MQSTEFISTGIQKLDGLLEGGIPKGFTTLILGTPGSSMEILSKQLATTDKVLYFTTEETEAEIIDTMQRFNWKNEDLNFVDIASKYSKSVLSGEQKRVSIYKQRSRVSLKELIEIGSSGIPPTARGSEDYLAILSNGIKNAKEAKIVISSLDFFLSQYSQDEVIRTIHAAKISNLANKGTLFVIMIKGIHGEVFERKMEGIADCVLELEVIQKGSNFERFLAVKKMRNYAKKIGIARYTIDSEGFVLEMIERIM
ncbi:MAG: RAD55 family ATPase [Candidatus Thermoplasmatota archaeon]|nr:RAD55 family ATPase [Candidatus Thermoplasmatota archaeon]